MLNPKNKAVSTVRNMQPNHGQHRAPPNVEAKTNARRPVAPPAYRPRQGNNPVQPKTAQRHAPPAAPPVYRPQPVPKCLQPKLRDGQQPVLQKPLTPKAPPAYRPQTVPKVLQTKMHVAHQPVNQPRNASATPQVYRPQRAQTIPPAKPVAASFSSPSMLGRPAPRTVQAKLRPSFKPGSPTVIQRMEHYVEPVEHEVKPVIHDVEMRSQLFTEGTPFDLNCGRYCSEAAIKWWSNNSPMKLQGDIFHELLPEPTPKSAGLFSIKASWSPGLEGAAFAKSIDKPNSIEDWKNTLTKYGPITVRGKLGAADWGILGGVGHYILIVGADVTNGKLYYKDPLQDNRGPIEEDFSHLNERINSAFVLKRKNLKIVALNQAYLKETL